MTIPYMKTALQLQNFKPNCYSIILKYLEKATPTLQKFITCSLHVCVILIYFMCQKMFLLKSFPCHLPCIYSNVSNNKSPDVLTQRGNIYPGNTLQWSLCIEGKDKKGCVKGCVERGNNLSTLSSLSSLSRIFKWPTIEYR